MDLGSIAEKCRGSNPLSRTIIQVQLGWLDRLIWDQEAASSSLVTWTTIYIFAIKTLHIMKGVELYVRITI